MIETDEITERLNQLEVARAQDMSLILARFDSVEADVEALAKRHEYQLTMLDNRLNEMDSRLSAHLSRLENKIDLIFEMLKTITDRLGE